MITVPFPLGDRSYEALVGRGARHRLAEFVPADVARAVVVSQPGIDVTVDPGVTWDRFDLDAGEEAKNLEQVEALCRYLASSGLTRRDLIVSVGGGVVSDVAGFAAAIYHRGMSVIHVPTTLLAQVDAALGGKTGVNIPEGKNLIGSFWQPKAVLCDTEVLESLPEREYRSGLGEVAKYHFLGGEGLDDLPMDEKVARCVELKRDVVCSDELESGRRATLNYGHTLAHALETAGRYDLRHGEAVSIGLVFAARLALALGRIDDERVKYHYAVVEGYGLPTALPAEADPDHLIELMRRDKKSDGSLTFVLDSPAGVAVVAGVEPSVVRDTLVGMT